MLYHCSGSAPNYWNISYLDCNQCQLSIPTLLRLVHHTQTLCGPEGIEPPQSSVVTLPVYSSLVGQSFLFRGNAYPAIITIPDKLGSDLKRIRTFASALRGLRLKPLDYEAIIEDLFLGRESSKQTCTSRGSTVFIISGNANPLFYVAFY